MSFNKYKESINNGLAGEKRFDELAEKRGCLIIEANRRDNMIRKIDRYVIDEEGILKSVDVKTMKRTSRSDANAQDKWIWIEFNNVNGNDGWLYGEADYIAFERKKDPGEKFPWSYLANKKIAIWHKIKENKLKKYRNKKISNIEIFIFIKYLNKIGYSVKRLNKNRKLKLVKSFQ